MVEKIIPERCCGCEHCEMREPTTYMPYRICNLTGGMVYFSAQNGWERMNWCPLAESEKESGGHT